MNKINLKWKILRKEPSYIEEKTFFAKLALEIMDVSYKIKIRNSTI